MSHCCAMSYFFARLKGPRAPPCLGGMMGARHHGSFPAPKSFAFLLLHALLPAQFKALGLAALRLLGMFYCQCVFNVALFVAIRRPRPTSDRAQLEPSVLTSSPLPSRQAPLLPCGATRPTAPKASLSAVLVTLRPGSREELPDAPGLCYPTFFPGLDPVRLRRPMPLYFSISFFGSVPANTSGPF